MKKILLVIGVALFQISCSNNYIKSSQVINKDGKVYKKGCKTPYTGGVIYKKDREYYKNGIPTGKWLTFYGNGKLKSIENWKNGKLNGKYILYNSEGNKTLQTYYINGKDSGEFKLYHENGTPHIFGQFVNGTAVGPWTYYDINGNIIETTDYSKQKQNFDQKS